MEVNTADVKKVGSHHYPELAGVYSDAASTLSSRSESAVSMVSHHEDLHTNLKTMSENVYKFLDESSSHLERCGEVLVDVANEYDWVDEDNSHHIEDASEGFDDKRS